MASAAEAVIAIRGIHGRWIEKGRDGGMRWGFRLIVAIVHTNSGYKKTENKIYKKFLETEVKKEIVPPSCEQFTVSPIFCNYSLTLAQIRA